MQSVLRAVGNVVLRRVCFVCRKRCLNTHPWDERLSVTATASLQSQRWMCQAGSGGPFGAAAKHLEEFCRLKVSDNKTRELWQGPKTKNGDGPLAA